MRRGAGRVGTVVVSLIWTIAFAQPSSRTADRIIETELRESRAFETLAYLTDRIGARFSGTPQAEAAVRWTTERLRSWGLDTHTEPIMVPRWVRGVEESRLIEPLKHEIALTTLGGSVATAPRGITADVIEVASYDELKVLGPRIRGKIVLYNKPMDRDKVAAGRAFEAYSDAVVFRSKGASRAAEYGAVAVLVRSVTTRSLRTPHTGGLRYLAGLPKIPAAAITTEDADLIHRLLARGQNVRVFLRLTPRTYADVPSSNVVAEIRGREKPEEIVLVGAHLDSWDIGTGAIDNGSGVAMVMETMRLLKELDVKPRRTIRAVLFMNEENGLRGGKGYAAAHKNEFHFATVETDAGTTAPLGFITSLDEEQIARLRPQLRALEKIGATQLEYAKLTGADTSPLVREGVPGFGLQTVNVNYFDYHHTAADTLDKVDPEELTMDCAAVAALTWTLADMPGHLPRMPKQPPEEE